MFSCERSLTQLSVGPDFVVDMAAHRIKPKHTRHFKEKVDLLGVIKSVPPKALTRDDIKISSTDDHSEVSPSRVGAVVVGTHVIDSEQRIMPVR
jgi:hypothetical protein